MIMGPPGCRQKYTRSVILRVESVTHEPLLPGPDPRPRGRCADLHRAERRRRGCDLPVLDDLAVPLAADPVHAVDRIPARMVPAYLLFVPERRAERGCGTEGKNVNKISMAVLLLAGVLGAAAACAQEFPTRPVRFMIPLAPGGGADITVRAVAQKLGASWKQTVVVDNRPGGTGTIALEMASRAAPDGYTIIMISGSHTARQAVERDLPWNLNRDFAPVTQMTRQSYVLVLHPGVAAKSVAELVNLAKAKPGTITFGSAGQGSLQHLSGALFGTLTQTKLLHVAYKGGGPRSEERRVGKECRSRWGAEQ